MFLNATNLLNLSNESYGSTTTIIVNMIFQANTPTRPHNVLSRVELPSIAFIVGPLVLSKENY